MCYLKLHKDSTWSKLNLWFFWNLSISYISKSRANQQKWMWFLNSAPKNHKKQSLIAWHQNLCWPVLYLYTFTSCFTSQIISLHLALHCKLYLYTFTHLALHLGLCLYTFTPSFKLLIISLHLYTLLYISDYIFTPTFTPCLNLGLSLYTMLYISDCIFTPLHLALHL